MGQGRNRARQAGPAGMPGGREKVAATACRAALSLSASQRRPARAPARNPRRTFPAPAQLVYECLWPSCSAIHPPHPGKQAVPRTACHGAMHSFPARHCRPPAAGPPRLLEREHQVAEQAFWRKAPFTAQGRACQAPIITNRAARGTRGTASAQRNTHATTIPQASQVHHQIYGPAAHTKMWRGSPSPPTIRA